MLWARLAAGLGGSAGCRLRGVLSRRRRLRAVPQRLCKIGLRSRSSSGAWCPRGCPARLPPAGVGPLLRGLGSRPCTLCASGCAAGVPGCSRGRSALAAGLGGGLLTQPRHLGAPLLAVGWRLCAAGGAGKGHATSLGATLGGERPVPAAAAIFAWRSCVHARSAQASAGVGVPRPQLQPAMHAAVHAGRLHDGGPGTSSRRRAAAHQSWKLQDERLPGTLSRSLPDRLPMISSYASCSSGGRNAQDGGCTCCNNTDSKGQLHADLPC